MGETAANKTANQGVLWGTVLAAQANFYWVQLDRAADLPLTHLLCTRRARLKKLGQQVMVGDRVRVEEPDWAGERGAIAEVAPRKTVLDRPPVANADQILLVFALAEPDLDPHQLSRFLVKAESTGLTVALCLNKQDLVSPGVQQAWRERLQHWGYTPVIMSVETGEREAELQGRLCDRITVVSGPSGVGKSSLINHLIPDIDLRTGTVSGKLGRGRHTTRHVELFELPEGGYLADTPGFNQPDMTCSVETLQRCFPEIQRQLAEQTCQFSDCLHRQEPGCAVGTDWERYPLYLDLLEEALAYEESQEQQKDPESALKVKMGESGQIQHEPRLQAKKYRQVSRRSRKQALQDLCDELTDSVDQLEDLDELVFDDM